jgi:hypothetical protein
MTWFGNKEKSPHNTYIAFQTCNYMVRYCVSIVAATVTLGVSQPTSDQQHPLSWPTAPPHRGTKSMKKRDTHAREAFWDLTWCSQDSEDHSTYSRPQILSYLGHRFRVKISKNVQCKGLDLYSVS